MSADIKAPKYPILDEIEIPENVLAHWQDMANLLADIAEVPAALIMRVHARDIEVSVASQNPGNVYHQGEKAPLDMGHYCETVMSTKRELLVPNALTDLDWNHNPDIQLGMISYCGLPLTWPSGEIFGTICILDKKENAYNLRIHLLLMRFRDSIQLSLAIIYDAWVERKQAKEALHGAHAFIQQLTASANVLIVILDAAGHVIECNHAVKKILGYTKEELAGINWFEKIVPKERYVHVWETFLNYQHNTGDMPVTFESPILTKSGEERFISWQNSVISNSCGEITTISFGIDITKRKQAETENAKLEAQLLQAQKMESVGRLAGGVAHDFNNMLSVILGHTEMALLQVEPGQPLFVNLNAIYMAAERSVCLTRQLLAFARKQTIAPKVLDLNETVEGMIKMLHRLIGEDIELLWKPGKNLQPVKVDPSQIDQLLANLCVNARDAIAGVGKVIIETDEAAFDEAYCAEHPGFAPGEYVLLAVSDNGCGMDKATLSHLFEPFFTTKEPGKGTGLGLASVYGMVKQNNGFINVTSEPGQGTTFKVYLPKHATRPTPMPEKTPGRTAERGHETILLVEDEPQTLHVTTSMLEGFGYTVVAATTPGEAIHLACEYSGSIDLLMTDMVMPGMNGRDLAKDLISRRPDLKCLFMSGYTADVISHHDVLNEGVHFIQKPFNMNDLAMQVRDALG